LPVMVIGARVAEHGGGVTAIVPLKALDRAKSRLATQLDATSRRELVAWMFDRVLDACLHARAVNDVLVVAGDQAAAEVAAGYPVPVLLEPRRGLSSALAAADEAAAGAPATVVVVADLPLLRAADVDAVCAAGRWGACAVVAATADGGTGAFLRRPAGVLPTAFGVASAAAHLRLAEAGGVRAVRLDLPGFALDVDTPSSLRWAGRLAPAVRRWSTALSSG
jgi:2-phospho-L-lactate/phosphoenolpyruvate guanylyltransferase